MTAGLERVEWVPGQLPLLEDVPARQHRMDPDCWCHPRQDPGGAWDHNTPGEPRVS